jgi:hypothetical protein
MIEKLLELKYSIRNKESKEIVKQKFIEYTNAYDEYGNKDVGDKLRHREMKLTYAQYMAGSGK